MPRPPKPAASLAARGANIDVAIKVTLAPAAVAALDALAAREDRSRYAEVRRAVEAWLATDAAPLPRPDGPRVQLRLPRRLVAALDRRVGDAPGARSGAVAGAVDAWIAEKSRRSEKSTRGVK